MPSTWINPANTALRVRVADDSAPAISPAPSGHLIVPAGYVRQLGNDGYWDTGFLQVNGLYVSNITQFVIPTYTGGFPPDPLNGQPGHTAQGR